MVDIVGGETLASLWDKLARECGEKDFFVFQGRDGGVETFTYRQFNEKINQTANMFLREGVAFGELIDAEDTVLAEQRALTPDDVCKVLFTSGTTSNPKGVLLTHGNMVYSGYYGNWETSMTASDRMLTTMPACHSNFQLAALTPVLTARATLIVVEKYSASRFWSQVREYRATLAQCVAMMLRTLMLQPTNPDERDHSLRDMLYFLPVSAREKEAFEERFGVRILNTYGSTESIGWVLTDPPTGERKWPSVGRVGLGYEAKIIDENGNELPANRVGEICVKGVPGRSLMLGSAIVPCVFLLIGRCKVPESPLWLKSKGRHEEARRVVFRVYGADVILEDEEEEPKHKAGFAEVFSKGYAARIVFLGILTLCQVVPMYAIYTFGPQIMTAFGLGVGKSAILGESVLSLFFLVGSLPAMFWLNSMGRRPLLIRSLFLMAVGLLALGLFPTAPFSR